MVKADDECRKAEAIHEGLAHFRCCLMYPEKNPGTVWQLGVALEMLHSPCENYLPAGKGQNCFISGIGHMEHYTMG